MRAAPNAAHVREYARRLREGGASAALEHEQLVARLGARVGAVDTGDPTDRYDLDRIPGALPWCDGRGGSLDLDEF